MIKVLVVDDHALVRQGFKMILSDAPGIQVVGEAGNSAEALEQVRQKRYDVVTLDIAMPGITGLVVLEQIRHLDPTLPVLMVSVHPEQQYAVRCLKAGARGYATKLSDPEELVTAIRKVAAGGLYITPSLAERLSTYVSADSHQPLHERLSNREFEVMCMIAAGQTAAAIAASLGISFKTVSTYKSRILGKMEMTNAAQVIRYAIEHGLVPGDTT